MRNLFTGIKMGLIEPAEIESYIEEAVNLTEAGKERRLQSAFKDDAELLQNIDKSQAAFGRVFAAPELVIQLIRAGGTEAAAVRASLTTYSRADPDADGLVRRVKPVIQTDNGPIEHITFNALKRRFTSVEFIDTRFNAALAILPASVKNRPPPPETDGEAAGGGAASAAGAAGAALTAGGETVTPGSGGQRGSATAARDSLKAPAAGKAAGEAAGFAGEKRSPSTVTRT